MKPFISQMMLAAAFVCVAGSASAQATYAWAIATSDQEQQEVNIAKYVTRQEVVAEGKTCHRILVFNKSHVPGNAEDMFLQTRYGFREEGRKVFVYDFETGQERVALDYTLAPGDPFTTYNGENWVITAARDTLIKDYGFSAQGYEKEHRLLEVRNTADGRTDTWLEGFGSFAHHLLIEQPAAGSLLLWVFDESPGEGTEHYIAREISADPLFAHDTGWMEGGRQHGPDDRPACDHRHAQRRHADTDRPPQPVAIQVLHLLLPQRRRPVCQGNVGVPALCRRSQPDLLAQRCCLLYGPPRPCERGLYAPPGWRPDRQHAHKSRRHAPQAHEGHFRPPGPQGSRQAPAWHLCAGRAEAHHRKGENEVKRHPLPDARAGRSGSNCPHGRAQQSYERPISTLASNGHEEREIQT